jgi:hypothetical protein
VRAVSTAEASAQPWVVQVDTYSITAVKNLPLGEGREHRTEHWGTGSRGCGVRCAVPYSARALQGGGHSVGTASAELQRKCRRAVCHCRAALAQPLTAVGSFAEGGRAVGISFFGRPLPAATSAAGRAVGAAEPPARCRHGTDGTAATAAAARCSRQY